MLRTTHTAWAPWFVAVTDDKKRGRLNIISHVLAQIPYEHLEHEKVELPKRKVKEVPPPPGAFVPVEETVLTEGLFQDRRRHGPWR